MRGPRYRFDPPLPGAPFIPAQALASTAIEFHAPAALLRGGPFGRAERLVASGATVVDAATVAAKQGKGHFGELSQSVSQTVNAALVGASHVARMNPIANDPLFDVEVLVDDLRVAGGQVKVGSPQYIARSMRRYPGARVIVNEESLEVLSERFHGNVNDLSDRLVHDGVQSDVLNGEECANGAARTLMKMLRGIESVEDFAVLSASLAAGAHDGLVALAIELAASVGHSLLTREPFDLRLAIRNAVARGAKAGARTTLQTHLVVSQFLDLARAEYSAHLLRRVAQGTILMGAIAEVAIETAIDLFRVISGRLTFEDMLRRFGVHVFSAGGAAAGALGALALTRGMHPLLQLVAVFGLGYLGSQVGNSIGQHLFLPAEPMLAP